MAVAEHGVIQGDSWCVAVIRVFRGDSVRGLAIWQRRIGAGWTANARFQVLETARNSTGQGEQLRSATDVFRSATHLFGSARLRRAFGEASDMKMARASAALRQNDGD
jgi:hypothetical protein